MPARVNGVVPIDIPLDGVRGEELLAVVVGKHHIELVFANFRLNVEGGYGVDQAGGCRTSVGRTNLRDGATALVELIGREITKGAWLPETGLLLHMGDGISLTAIVDGSGYESFSFSIPSEPGIVVV